MIENINSDVFRNQKYLRSLDVSFNPNLNIALSLLSATKTLDTLDLSGIKTGISFSNIKDVSLTHLITTNSNVTDIKVMQLNELRRLHSLELSYNEISKLEVGSFDNISTLTFLNLSHNKIRDIQPGIFKDNTKLASLNLSHNSLAAITYGIFYGLIHLSTLDISFNYIKDLQNERFYEVAGLTVLIADHNKIESLTAEEFVGTKLAKLSIGGNPIPCEVLVNLKRSRISFEITAINLHENNDENVDGVTCNRKLNTFRVTNVTVANADDNVKILLNIRDIMLEHLEREQINNTTMHSDNKYLADITGQIKTTNDGVNKMISNLVNLTNNIVAKSNTEIFQNKMYAITANNETNVLLTKILRVLTLNPATKAPPIQVTKGNATYENLLLYINKVKQELEDTFTMNKEKILSEMESRVDVKISDAHLINEKNIIQAEVPKHEKLSASDDSKSKFTEICVGLILVILVGFILYKVYKSRVFVRQRFSVSTRELPGSMDLAL